MSIARGVGVVLAFLLPSIALAQLSSDDQAYFDKHFADMVQVEYTPLTGGGIDKVFSAPLYRVHLTIEAGPESQTADTIAAKTDSKIVTICSPSTDEDLPQMKTLINPQFKLNTDDDGKAFESALEVMDPVPTINLTDAQGKATSHQGNQWTFARGSFIGHHKGYVVRTDDQGTVTSVKYSLNLP